MTTDPRSNFKGQDKSLRQQMVIDAAIKIFHRKGYRTTTLDDVAQDLGLTKPALYHYVSSKENLLSLIYLRSLEIFFSTIYEIPNMKLSPVEKMRLFIRRHLKSVVIENLTLFSVFFSEESQLPQEDFQRIQVEKKKFTQVVEEIIEDGVNRGYFKPLNPKIQAYAIIGMCNWLYRWYNPESSPFSPDEIVDQFVSLLENGYVQQEKRAPLAVKGETAPPPQVDILERKREILEELQRNLIQSASLIDELNRLG